ncbi:MAG: hypothetical protein E7073_06690 [Bacteroidales bacterium]|nr:hypothetical protein [Bacteroidales bacterium]
MRKVDAIFNSMVGKGETAPYIDCDYIESDGNGQYIDTGLKGYNDTSMVFHYLSSFGTAGIFGAYDYNNGGATSANELLAYFAANHMYYGKGSGWTGAITAIYPDRKQYTLDVAWLGGNSTKFTLTDIDTQTVKEATVNRALVETPMSLLLFAVNDGTTGNVTYNTGSLKMGHVERYDNGVLTQDLYPKVRRADMQAGMLDVVNNVFHTNANPAGANFLYGNL